MTIDADWLISSVVAGHHFDVPLARSIRSGPGRRSWSSTSQYGVLYPYIAAWSVAPFGLSVRTLSASFAMLSLLCWAFVYAAVGRKSATDRGPRSAFVAAFIGLTHPVSLSQLLRSMVSPYYPVLPDPCDLGERSSSGIVPTYLRNPDLAAWLAGYLAAGFWLLWNLDTGLVVLVAWFGLQGFRAIASWREGLPRVIGKLAGHAFLTALTVVLAIGSYCSSPDSAPGDIPTSPRSANIRNLLRQRILHGPDEALGVLAAADLALCTGGRLVHEASPLGKSLGGYGLVFLHRHLRDWVSSLTIRGGATHHVLSTAFYPAILLQLPPGS